MPEVVQQSFEVLFFVITSHPTGRCVTFSDAQQSIEVLFFVIISHPAGRCVTFSGMFLVSRDLVAFSLWLPSKQNFVKSFSSCPAEYRSPFLRNYISSCWTVCHIFWYVSRFTRPCRIFFVVAQQNFEVLFFVIISHPAGRCVTFSGMFLASRDLVVFSVDAQQSIEVLFFVIISHPAGRCVTFSDAQQSIEVLFFVIISHPAGRCVTFSGMFLVSRDLVAFSLWLPSRVSKSFSA
ncbi:hypothetical protein CDAR_464841 [Caerostris darwini]|uniref:Uncharacterized protein n=1 Tax=Caerostris darwini TaxID=1538125 RepID=A0AAV4QK89_9ARAC|nr:hypothetical protein CDAR_464841 [Caerostris darwini]